MWGKRKKEEHEVTLDEVEVLIKDKRELLGFSLMVVNIICFIMAIFHLYAAGIGSLTAIVFRAIHLGFGMSLVFLLYPITKKTTRNNIPWWDLLLAIISIVPNLYIVLEHKNLALRAGLLTRMDMVMGVIILLTMIEVARRVVGPILTGIATFFLFYNLFGNYFPGLLAYRGTSLAGLIRHMYLSTEGLYGVALGASANFIFLFVLLGAIFTHAGAGDVLIDLALALFGRQRGGPAKAAVFSSMLFGMISGSSLGNIATTGTFTIPLMKKVGFKPAFAGAVEAAASIGGQVMPPVMGTAAFLIAEFVGISYLEVCMAAIIPAILYFTSIFFAVHQASIRLGIQGLPGDQLPKAGEILKKKGYLLLPMLVVIFVLIKGFSPSMAAFLAICSGIILSWINPKSRLTPKKLFYALADGARNAVSVLVACAVVGFIVGSFTLSGLGLKMASIVIQAGGGYLLPTLILTAGASIVLGMGVPTTANYIMMSMITVPAVVAMGVEIVAAHLFCFYFGLVADLTPPVALGALTGAGIAGAKFFPTAINATKLGIVAYVIPFYFVYKPILLLGVEPFSLKVIFVALSAAFGIMVLSCGLFNYVLDYLKKYERLIIFGSAFILIHPGILSSLLGLGLFLFVVYVQKHRLKQIAT